MFTMLHVGLSDVSNLVGSLLPVFLLAFFPCVMKLSEVIDNKNSSHLQVKESSTLKNDLECTYLIINPTFLTNGPSQLRLCDIG